MRSAIELRRDAESIFRAGLDAVDSKNCVAKFLSRKNSLLSVDNSSYDLADYENIYVVGTGKASAAMAQAAEGILGEKITGGWINVKYGHSKPLEMISLHEAGHPVPDEAGLEGTRAIVELLKKSGDKDLVLCLIDDDKRNGIFSAQREKRLRLIRKQSIDHRIAIRGAYLPIDVKI